MVLKGIKMILAAFGALVVAQAIGLSSASVASIIAILSVVDTRKSSIVIAWKRIISMSLALTIAVCVFLLLGHSTVAFGVYLLIFTFLYAGFFAIWLIILKKVKRKTKLPLVPFIALSYLTIILIREGLLW